MHLLHVKTAALGALLVGTLISGMLLTSAGRPLSTGLLSLHKISSVLMIALFAIFARQVLKTGNAQAIGLTFAACTLSAICFIALLVTGALLSFERDLPQVVFRIHQIAPVFCTGAVALSVIALLRRVAA